MKKSEQNKVKKAAEKLEMSVNFSGGFCDISFYTNYGQDFCATVEEGNDLNKFIGNLSDYIDDFDPDEEASYWIGPDGHGKNGAPYHICDIVADFEECERRLRELYDAL